MRGVPGYECSQAYQLGIFVDLIRHFLGRHWIPGEIGIEHPNIPAVVEEQLPGVRILTRQPVGYIAVPRDSVHWAARCTDPKPGVAYAPGLTTRWDSIERLRELLKPYLVDGYPPARFAAEIMGVSERTLARRLAARGLTYGTLIDEMRFAEAKKLLQKPDIQIEDVAISVGFNDQSNFTRMFRRIGGLSPREFRKTVRR